MKKFLFKDGTVITASTIEQAKQKYKVTAKPKIRPSVPVETIQKIINLGFDSAENDVELNTERFNFGFVEMSNASSSNFARLYPVKPGNSWKLTLEKDKELLKPIFQITFKTLDEAVKFLEKPGVMFTLKEIIKE